MATEMTTQTSGHAPSVKVAPSAAQISGGRVQAQGSAPVAHQVSQPGSQSELASAVEEVSSRVQNVQRNLNFSIDDKSGETVVKVIDSSSEEVIRQIPSEEMLALARHMRELDEGDSLSLLQTQV